MSSSDQRVILVTGANKGIGLEAVKQLSERIPSATILLGSRSVSNGEEAIRKLQSGNSSHKYDNIEIVSIEITSQASIQAAVEHVKSTYGKLDVLLHNSAVASLDGSYVDPEILNVNVIGAHDTVEAFRPLIPKDGLVVLVSSEVGSWTMQVIQDEGSKETKELYDRLNDPAQNDWETVKAYVADWSEYIKTQQRVAYPWPKIEGLQAAYTVSKALVTAWTRHFAKAHPELKVAIVCPGYCATELNNWQGTRPASQGGTSIIWPIFNDFESGQFYQDGKKKSFSFAMPADFFNPPK